MASKKDKNKSSKTAHVLNLITTPAQRQAASSQPTENAEAVPSETPAAAPAVPSRPLTPPIVEVANSQDEKIASQIRSALTDELTQLADEVDNNQNEKIVSQIRSTLTDEITQLDDETDNSQNEKIVSQIRSTLADEMTRLDDQTADEATAAAPAAPVVSEAAPTATAPEPEPILSADPEPAVSADPEAMDEPVAASDPGLGLAELAPNPEPSAPATPEPAPAPVHTAPAPTPEALPTAGTVSAPLPPEPPRGDFHGPAPTPQSGNDLLYVNIMQTIVESMAPRYIKMFGVCKCSRCAADVKALTLTNLAPKYAVFHRRDRIPMLTVYENRYGSIIAAQLTKACSIVKINPHHR